MLHTAARATDPFIHLFPGLVDQLKEHEEVTDEVQRRRQSEASLEVHNQIVKLELPNFLRFSLYFCCGGAIKCRVDSNYHHRTRSLLNIMNCLMYWEAKIISFDFPILKHPLDMTAFLFNSQLCQKISFDE